MAATAVLAEHAGLLTGVVLELGVGEHPFARSATTVSVDIDASYGPDIRGDAHALPLAGSSFDTVVASPHDYQRLTRYGLEQLFEDQPFDIDIRAFGGRLPAALDLVVTSTASSSVLRRGLRKARKAIVPPRPQEVTRLGRWLAAREPNEFPMGYVVVATRRAG